MKATLALVCSLMLVWTQLILAPASACSAERAPRACCQGHHQASCCAAKSSSESQSPPAAPDSSQSQHPISFLTTAAPAWTLPDAAVCLSSSCSQPSTLTAGAPLYERNCTLLL